MEKAFIGSFPRVTRGWICNLPLVSGQQIATAETNDKCVKPAADGAGGRAFPF